MIDTIVRFECPECGRGWESTRTPFDHLGLSDCPGVPVERTYVAVELLTAEEHKGIRMGLIFGVPEPEPELITTAKAKLAAIAAVTETACPTCKDGTSGKTRKRDCPTCGGKGSYAVQSTRGHLTTDTITCPTCKGEQP